VVLLGGDGKAADFSLLVPSLQRYARAVTVMGKDAALIRQALDPHIACTPVSDMQEAVKQAVALAQPGDIILLSPACASTDQYQHYMHRGDVFSNTVHALKD
jgi:UDP-N-acetylmuramoylalanine--D-glutamate ligase